MAGANSGLSLAKRLALALAATTGLIIAQSESELDRYSDIARQALSAKKWDEAAHALERLAQLAPDVPQVHANLGFAYYSEGRPAQALASLERAQKLDPRLPQLEAMIGICRADLGHCRDAILILKPAFQQPSSDDMGRLIGLHLLRCYSQTKQTNEALSVGEILVGRFPNDPQVIYEVSRLHAERSSELMATLLASAPDSAWMHFANAQVQEGLGHLDPAAQEYRRAIEKDPGMTGVHYELGRLILRESRSPEAVARARKEFEQELVIAPGNADAEYELGEIDREQNQYQSALAHFEQALRYYPDFVEARVAVAKVLLATGQTAAAIPHLQTAEHLEPNNKIPHYLLASAYKSLGKADQAEEEFATYRRLDANKASTEPEIQNSDHQ